MQKLRDNPHDLLITILIGNNLVQTSASVLAAYWATEVFDSNVLAYVTGVVTFLALVFGDILPKSFAQRYAEGFARMIAPFLVILNYLFLPFVWLLTGITKITMQLFGAHTKMKSFTEDELLAMVDIGTEEGELDEEEKELIENVLEFSETTVEEVMTPRPQMEVLDEETSLAEAIEYINTHSHSRIPIYRDKIDNIVGVLSVRQLLHFISHSKNDVQLKDLELAMPLIIPESKPISDLFKDFQKKRMHIAIIVDEHGGVSGLVTMEDILEELVGDIVDESDIEKVLIKKVGQNSWILSGEALIEDINEAVGIELQAPEYKTISYLILEEHQEIPKVGEKIDLGNVELLVEKVAENKIQMVRLLKKL